MNEKPAYFGILTADVRYDKRLKPMEKILFSEISALCDMNGWCEATNSYFAELYEVSIETVSRWISNLKKYGYIESRISYKTGTKEVEKRVLRIITKSNQDPLDENVNTPRQKNQDPLDEKIKVINTLTESINNKKTSKKEKSLLLDFYKTYIEYAEFVSIDTLLDFIRYRREIKKAVKTPRALKAYIDSLAACVKAGYTKETVIDLMKSNEWQTVKLEWVKKTLEAPEKKEWK